MKKLLSMALLAAGLMASMNVNAQSEEDKSKRPSPPAKVTQKINTGATISIDYSQPSVKGRTIGNNLEPMDGKVWRTGANEATVFETDRDVTIDGKKFPAGKYSLFTLFNGKTLQLYSIKHGVNGVPSNIKKVMTLCGWKLNILPRLRRQKK